MQTNEELQRRTTAAPIGSGSVSSATSYLGPGLEINGEISGNEDLQLDSKFEGQVSIGGFRLTVGPKAQLTADIIAREAVISGNVKGDIRAHDRIEIMRTASITGDLTTSKIMIEEGAYLKGEVEVGGNNPPVGTDLDSLLKGEKKTNGK
jgi:cytoskeletal protein CcmA (bactofilin family)